jgi:hypothetical protein
MIRDDYLAMQITKRQCRQIMERPSIADAGCSHGVGIDAWFSNQPVTPY